MKKILFTLIVFLILSSLLRSPVNALGNNNFRDQMQNNIRNTVREEIQNQTNQPTGALEMQNRIRNEVRQELQEQKKNFWEEMKNRFKKLSPVARVTGTINAISGNSFTVVDKENKTYTVNVTEKTQLRRRFWGKATLAEFAVGNEVNVIGRWADDSQTTIEAKLIRNLSIQRRWGVFFGMVTAKNADNFVMATYKRDAQAVYFNPETKFIKRNQEAMTYDDLAVGHKVRVKGVWDKSLNQIIEVEEVKDFSLPPYPNKLTPTSGPATTLTPTMTPTLTPTAIPTETPTPI